MRAWMVSLALAVLLLPAAVRAQVTQLENEQQRLSYAIGLNSARSMVQRQLDIDIDAMIQGVRDGFSRAEPLLTEEELRTLLQDLQRQLVNRNEEALKSVGEEARARAEAFLAENAKREGVVVLPSGLQYEVLRAGDGPTPKPGERVTAHFRGSLLNGTVFDSTLDRGDAPTFALAGQIKGLQEALERMQVGAHWRVWVPSEMGYGEAGAVSRLVPPNAMLIYEIELFGVQPGG